MKRIAFIALFLMLSSVYFNMAVAQFDPAYAHHLDEVNIAKVFMADNKVDSAIVHYKEAMDCFDDKGRTWFDFATVYEANKDYKKAIDAYGMAVLKGYFPCYGQDTTDFPNWGSNSPILPFVKNLDSLKAVFYFRNYNREFADLANNLAGADMFVRRTVMFADPHDSIYNGVFMKVFNYVDTGYNLPRILEYLDTHPFPAESSLDGLTFFWLLVHHILQNEDTNPLVARLRAHVLNAVYQGKYDHYSYVRTLDYCYSGYHNNKQLYGTYKNKNKNGDYIYSSGIDSIQTVDARRAKWHLLPLYLDTKVNELHPLLPEGYDQKTQKK